jgi:hypothetical protein
MCAISYVKDRVKMNKIQPYVLVAILLGAVTMVVPYVLLGSSDNTSLGNGGTLIQPSAEQPTGTEQLDNREPAYSEGKDVESSPSVPTDEPPAEEPAPSIGGTDLIVGSLSNLSPIILITVPSFLIALSVFIYLKKRRP